MREDAIARFVERVTTVAFQPPTKMDAEAQASEATEMARAVSRTLPRRLLPEQVDAALEGALSSLRARARSRAWPLISEVVEAVKGAAPPDTRDSLNEGDALRREVQAETAIRWWHQFGDLPTWLHYEHVFAAVIESGVPARTLWLAGVPLPKHMRTWEGAA